MYIITAFQFKNMKKNYRYIYSQFQRYRTLLSTSDESAAQ